MSVKEDKIVSFQDGKKYLESWENEFDWVMRDPSSRRSDNAFCKLCRRSMLPKMSVLVTHNKSQVHRSMAAILQSNKDPKFERRRKQPRTESILLRQTLSKTELELNEDSAINQSVIVVSSADHSMLPDVGEVGEIVKISSVPSSDVTLVSEDRVPYTLSVIGDPPSSGEVTNTTGVVVEQELNLGLVDVNKMNIQEMELLDNEDTIMVLEEEEEDDEVEEEDIVEEVTEHVEVEYDPADVKHVATVEKEEEGKNLETLSSNVNVSAITHFINTLQPEVLHRFKTGEEYDAIWKCDGGAFKVHKAVLAASSEYLKGLMNEDDNISVIQTPELSKDIVRAILCLLYSGKVNVSWGLLNLVNDSFKTIGFFGNNLTATPQREVETDISQSIQYNTSNQELSVNQTKVTKVARKVEDDAFAMIDDLDLDADIPFQEDLLDDSEDFVPPQQNMNESSDEEYQLLSSVKTEIKSEFKEESSLERGKRKRKRNPKYISAVNELKKELDDSFSKTKEPHDTISTYVLRTRGKGDLALSLKDDLFEDPDVIENVRVISVCLVCLQYFDNYEKLKEHKRKVHNKKRIVMMDYHKSILGNDQYRCPKCSQVFKLKHVVWLVKHLKFCGQDPQKADELLGVDDVDEKSSTVDKIKEEESATLVVADRGRNAHEMSRFFFNRDVHTIWGCRLCYEVFASQAEYDKHQAEMHPGSSEVGGQHGSCYDPETRVFTCMYCNTYKTARPLVHFIYHLKRCLCDPSIGAHDDDEEDADEDTVATQDEIDPWGIVNKPLRVTNDKSKWICEALFGRYIPILYPCHICYNVFEFEDELKEHFRLNHAGQENCCDNGSQYDREKEVYTCPICKRQVCHKQKSAIYFAYHMRKCAGNTHPVSRTCPDCNKTFTSFRPYMFHTKNNCQTKDLLCHICSQSFKDIKYLANHLSYVHSTARPYRCTKCDKSYKRRPELNMHMQTHGDTMEYSCEKCGKAFFRKRNLKVHMLTHMSEAEKRFACHLCSHRFSKKAFLVNHLTTHSSFRRYACEVCGSQVKTKDSLKQHRKRVHKLVTPLPQACVLQQEPEFDPKLTTSTTVVVKEETVIEEFQF